MKWKFVIASLLGTLMWVGIASAQQSTSRLIVLEPVATAPPVATARPKRFQVAFSWVDVINDATSKKRVDLELKNATVAEALKQLFQRVKLDFVLEDDVPADVRLSLTVKDVRFATALRLITEAGKVGWRWEWQGQVQKDRKLVCRIGKSIKTMTHSNLLLETVPRLLADRIRFLDVSLQPLLDLPTIRLRAAQRPTMAAGRALQQRPPLLVPRPSDPFSGRGQFHTFRCRHCKNQVTLRVTVAQPKCAKCRRGFQPDWKFCPYDGASRPATAPPLRFCPVCGKRAARPAGTPLPVKTKPATPSKPAPKKPQPATPKKSAPKEPQPATPKKPSTR